MTKSNGQNNSSQHNSSTGKIGGWAKTFYELRALYDNPLALGLEAVHMQALDDFIDFLKLCDHERLGFYDLRETAVIGELARTAAHILSSHPSYQDDRNFPDQEVGRPLDFPLFLVGVGDYVLVLDHEDMEALKTFVGLVRRADEVSFPVPACCNWSDLVGWLAVEFHTAIKAMVEEFGDDNCPKTKRIEVNLAKPVLADFRALRVERESERAEPVLTVIKGEHVDR